MAQRRMFSKTITNSSNFLMMPQSAQNLYFHLGMNADDDGFCEHFTIMRMTESKPDDLKILQAKRFVRVFDDHVLVVVDWKENNYIQRDRYSPSKYLEIYKKELKLLVNSDCIQDVYKTDTQVRLGKVRLGKVIDTGEQGSQIPEVIALFKEVNPSYRKWFGNITQRGACERLLKVHGFDRIKGVVSALPETNKTRYMPNITTPLQLEDKWSDWHNGIERNKPKVVDSGILDITAKRT